MDSRIPLQSGTTVGGDYLIEKVLGVGGFGITYLAHDERLDVKVAIKEYFPASLAYREDGATVQPLSNQGGADYEWGLERFLAEAQTLARLRHPNIVRVSRYFQENDTAYMVLGFVEGQDYEDYLKNLGRAPTQEELDALIEPVLKALETVHAADLVHRDIKPQNIFIRAEDNEPIILDFGAARQALGEHSRATAAFVSPGYSPSESHLNDPTDQGPWTDIYSFAATLYRALIGRPPVQVLSRVSHDTYVPLARQLPNPGDYRPGFLAAIDQALSVRREDRPQSVAAWREQFSPTGGDAETVVRRPAAETKVISDPGATVIANQNATRVVDPPPGRSNEPPTVANRTAQPPPPSTADPANKGMRWLWAAVAVIMGIAGLTQIYSSFQSSPDTDTASRISTTPDTTRQTDTTPTQPLQPETQPTTPQQPATRPVTPPPRVPANPGPTRQAFGPASGSLFATDPSFRRIATASWLSAGLQNGYWTASNSGSNGSSLSIGCRGTNDTRRDSVFRLESVPTAGSPLSGQHEVRAQLNGHNDSVAMTFTSANGLSEGTVSINETAETTGQLLNFLHLAFLSNQMVITIPSIGYSETFLMNGAEEALNVCFGADVEQAWRAIVPHDRVAGGEVRKANGATLVVRCDTTANRGNAVVLFATPSRSNVAAGLRRSAITIGGVERTGDFFMRSVGNSLTGVLYHPVTDNNSRQIIQNFLGQMRRSNQFTVSNTNPRFSETYPLTGSRQALSGCLGG